MNSRFAVRNMTKPRSLKFMILTVCVAICLTAWLAIAKLQASENNMDHPDAYFQNAAQAQHADNVATQAALQDPIVERAIERAKESRDPRDIRRARRLFNEKKDHYVEEISDMRESGMGWGDIAKELEVHPSFLGLGHSKFRAKHHLDFKKHTRMRSEIKAATARSFKGEVIKGHVANGSVSKHKSLSLAPKKGREPNNGRGLALGHSKSKGGTVTAGQTTGNGKGHGNGRGLGNSSGRGGGNGGGHGGGNGGGKK